MKKKIIQITALDSTMKNMLGLLNKRSKEAGFEIHCICSPGREVDRLRQLGYIVHPVKIDRQINILSNISSIKHMIKIMKEVKPDIVHVHTPIASVLGRIAAKLANVKDVIYTAHGFYFHENMPSKKYKLFFNIEKWTGRLFTDFIFTQSEEDYILAKSHNFLSRKKNNNYLHISNGIDITERFNIKNFDIEQKNHINKTLDISENSVTLAFIGRLVKEKGILDLIRAFDIVSEQYEVNLIVMGSPPKSERDQSLSDLIKGNKRKNVHFLGSVKNVEDYLYASDIFILPSYREGMPRSIIEAMALENAIIATNIRGSREEVIDNHNGFLVNLSSPEEIAEKIITLINEKELLRKMKISSFNDAIKKYDEEEVVRKQINIFKKVSNQNEVEYE